MGGEKQIKKAYESLLEQDFNQAIEWFEQAIAEDPGNAAYHYKLSITFARSNKLHKALASAERALELAENNEEYQSHLYHLRAKDAIQQAEKYLDQSTDQLHFAVSLLNKAVMLDSLAIDAYFMLGLAYAGLGEYSNAIQSMKKVIGLDPGHGIAYKLLRDYETKDKKGIG